jgi:hypothetical protein
MAEVRVADYAARLTTCGQFRKPNRRDLISDFAHSVVQYFAYNIRLNSRL